MAAIEQRYGTQRREGYKARTLYVVEEECRPKPHYITNDLVQWLLFEASQKDRETYGFASKWAYCFLQHIARGTFPEEVTTVRELEALIISKVEKWGKLRSEVGPHLPKRGY